MNILIGVLSESYMNAVTEQEQMFMHERAKIVLDARLRTNAWEACLRRWCPCCSSKIRAVADELIGADADTEGYIWFSWSRAMSKFGALDEDDDDTLAEQIAVVKKDIERVEAQVMSRIDKYNQEREDDLSNLIKKCTSARDQQHRSIEELQDILKSIDEDLTAVKGAAFNKWEREDDIGSLQITMNRERSSLTQPARHEAKSLNFHILLLIGFAAAVPFAVAVFS